MTHYFKGFWLSVLFHGVLAALIAALSIGMAAKPGRKIAVDLSALMRESPPVPEQPAAPQAKPKTASKSRPQAAKEETRPVVNGAAETLEETAQEAIEEAAGGGAARYAEENYYYIQRLINERLVYPGVAKRSGWQGKVYVGFTVEADGSVSNVRIAQSSGHSVLDTAVLNALADAAPFPPPPVPAALVIPVEFKLI